jgi:hypothetical protein
MDIVKYRKLLLTQLLYVTPFHNSQWDELTLKVKNPEEYELLHQRNIPGSGHPFYTTMHERIENHPLVKTRDAYWQNRTTLCIGYTLKANPSIFRPIFSHARQALIDKLLPSISLMVKRREKSLTFMAIFKIKKIPKVIIDKIMKLI